jgi:hypothetical protein
VKKSPKMYPNHFWVKFKAQPESWKKVVQKFALLL